MEIIKKHISMNYSKGVKITPKYIVVHETDNTNKGADSNAHFNYWNTNDNAQSSVHFVVDDKQAIQLLELNERAWHVGDNRNYSDITNSNSIGIEICVNSDGDYDKAYNNCIELVKYLMQKTGLGIDRVVRHYDASGKKCPTNIINKNLWGDFKNKVQSQGSGNMGRVASVQDAKNFIGNKTTELQTKLNQLGYNCGAVDGDFGNGTLNALTKFQGDNGLTIDGYAGNSTFSKLDELITIQEMPKPKAQLNSFIITEDGKETTELHIGGTYKMNANATSPNGCIYEYWVSKKPYTKWIKLYDHSSDSSKVLTFGEIGEFRVLVYARDLKSNLSVDSEKFVDIVVKDVPKAQINGIKITQNGNETTELSVDDKYIISAYATCQNECLYEYWISDLSTNAWIKLYEYSKDDDKELVIAKAGKYRVLVYVRDIKSKLNIDSEKFIDVEVKARIDVKEELLRIRKEIDNLINNL